jgi:NifU-like protein involved in Fe-S cluster formation
MQNLLTHVGNIDKCGKITDYTHKCTYKNYMCGDKVYLYLKLKKKIIKKISYETESCLICQASCSIFSDCVRNKNLNTIINFTKLFISSIFKTKIKLSGKWKKYNFLLKKNYFNRKGCILVPFNALIKIR